MIAILLRRAVGLLLLLSWCTLVGAQVPVPALRAPVTDLTATLTAGQRESLDAALRAFEARKGSQVAVLIVPTTQPESIEQFGIRVADQWKLGRKKVDDGAILIIAKDDRTLRIEVGYGLEGALTDAASKRIISDVVVPRLRQGDYFAAVRDGVDRMMLVIDGEPLPAPARNMDGASTDLREFLPVVLIIAFVLGRALRGFAGRLPAAAVTGGVVAVIGWMILGTVIAGIITGVIAFVFTLIGSVAGMTGVAGQRGWGGSGGFGSGGSGGGFSGGGGGFGGGGASGRW